MEPNPFDIGVEEQISAYELVTKLYWVDAILA